MEASPVVTNKHTWASFDARLNASVRTGVVVFACVLAANMMTASCFPVDAYLMRLYQLSENAADTATAAFQWLPAVFWFIADGTWHRATYGMRKSGLGFRRTDDATAGRLRCLARLVAGLLMLPLLPFSWAVALIDGRHRTLPDLLCGTVMVEQAPAAVAGSKQPAAFPIVPQDSEESGDRRLV